MCKNLKVLWLDTCSYFHNFDHHGQKKMLDIPGKIVKNNSSVEIKENRIWIVKDGEESYACRRLQAMMKLLP